MSPRKSTSSAGEVDMDASPEAAHGNKQPAQAETGVNVEDFLLPRSVAQRLAKSALPPNTIIQKDAMLAITKAATVFVSYLSSHANEETQKKTVSPQDVLAALSEIEFDAFRPRLERELAAYTDAAAQKRKGKKGCDKKGEGKAVEDENEDHGAKRLKRDAESEIAARLGPGNEEEGGKPGRNGTEVTLNNGAHRDQRHEAADELDSDGTEDQELEDEEHADEDEEEEEEEEHDDDETEEEPVPHEDDLEEVGSDTGRRRHPDLDSGSESDSDGP